MSAPLNVHILVLDDEPFMLQLLVKLLNNLGYTSVASCDNGHAALRLVDDAVPAPQLILCDLNMPVMDGMEFIRKLVDHGYAGCLILVSGEDERTLQAASKLAEIHGIEVVGRLHKPVSSQLLSELLSGWEPPARAAARLPDKRYGADRLSQAIREGELLNHYQPKIAVATGEIEGVEALVRWLHPQDGMVFPDQFIALAEANGLIDALTSVVLAQALQDSAVWGAHGLRLKVAVNISMVSLAALAFPEMISALAAAAAVEPLSIVLEVTESQLMKDLRAPLEVLMRLRMRRFKLSIDDFGTGHSSLVQLRDVPFDELKIDRSFVHGAHSNETNRTIFFASLRLAKELGLEVVAEGVEDQADWDFLQKTGCDLAQGYFIARPMPAQDLLEWVDSWRSRRGVDYPKVTSLFDELK